MLKALYYALVHPHRLYCNTILNCTSAANIKNISTMQKKGHSFYLEIRRKAHTDVLFKKLKILPFYKLSKLCVMNFMHSIKYQYAPKSFINVFKLNNERNVL